MMRESLSDLDLLRLRYWLGQMVLLLALSGLIYEDVSHSPLLIFLTVFVGCTIIYPPLSGVVPRRFAVRLSYIALLLVIADFAIFWRYSIDPIIRMGLLMIVMRTVFYRTGRETSQVLVLSLGLIMVTGVTSVSASYALQLMVFVPMSMILLILLTVWDPDARDVMTHEDWRGFSILTFSGRLVRAMNWRIPLMIFAGSVVWLTMAIGFFLIFPRFNFGSGISMQRRGPEGSAMVGFSEEFSLGGITDILNDDRVAFRVYPDGQSTFPRFPYWKMLVMDHYERGHFSRSNRGKDVLHSLHQTGSRYYLSRRSFPPDFPKENGSEWTVYLEGSVSRYLPYPGAFQGLRFQKVEDFEYDPVLGTFNLLRIPSSMIVFQLIGLHPDSVFNSSVMDHSLDSGVIRFVRPSDLPDSGVWRYPGTTQSLVLNEPDADYLMSQVRAIQRTMAETGSMDYLQAVVQYLRRNHEYSLRPPAHRSSGVDDDPVVDWIRKGSAGHCEYFAAAFTLLSRAAGYPCRIVRGFSGGEWSEYREYFVVRNRNAHAWCEVFDADSGWVRYDPTPSSGLLNEGSELDRRGSVLVMRLAKWVDNFRMRYYRYVIDFDEQDQMDVIMTMQYRMPSWSSAIERGSAAIARWMSGRADEGSEFLHKGVFFKWLTVLGLLFVGVYYVSLLRRRVRKKRYPVGSRGSVPRGYEARMRWKSRKVLLGILTYRVDSMGPVFSQLQCIRFGRVSDWPDRPGRVIRDAARGLRRSIRDRRRIKR